MSSCNIAILGAGSHIAKGLIHNLLGRSKDALVLFTRDPGAMAAFLASIGQVDGSRCRIKGGYDEFASGNYDVVINCIGMGSPSKLRNFTDWFLVTEQFDNLVLDYQRTNPAVVSIAFSSGAVYGRDTVAAVSELSANSIRPNHIRETEYYAIAKLNSEAKHRAHEGLRIVDLRVFSYFSRFADLDSGYFITDVVGCIANKTVLKTDASDIVRDYVHPDDLYDLTRKCLEAGPINDVFDVVSAAPVRKLCVLEQLEAKFGLKYQVIERLEQASPNGSVNVYYSSYNKAEQIGYRPVYTSLQTLCHETEALLSRAVGS